MRMLPLILSLVACREENIETETKETVETETIVSNDSERATLINRILAEIPPNTTKDISKESAYEMLRVYSVSYDTGGGLILV